jgi:hypothetical protein
VVLWVSAPDVAVMVTVYWPAGVVELFDILDFPEQPVMLCINRTATKADPQVRSHSFLRLRSTSISGKRSPASTAPDSMLLFL